jgi:hypothetical protein
MRSYEASTLGLDPNHQFVKLVVLIFPLFGKYMSDNGISDFRDE